MGMRPIDKLRRWPVPRPGYLMQYQPPEDSAHRTPRHWITPARRVVGGTYRRWVCPWDGCGAAGRESQQTIASAEDGLRRHLKRIHKVG